MIVTTEAKNEHQQSIKELSRIAIYNDLTMMVAWSNDEVAQYIAQFKMYEHKSAATLKEKVHQQYKEQLQHVLTTGKRVNKTDANNLASQFGVRLAYFQCHMPCYTRYHIGTLISVS
jgi:DNA excision repair protein ERCC-1